MRTLILLFIFTIYLLSCSNPSESKNDNNPPIIKITYSSSDTTVSGIVEIQCDVSDDGGIKKVELVVDSLKENIFDDEAPYILQWDTRNYKKDSFHKIWVIAEDNNGNLGTSDTLVFKVDNANSHPSNPTRIESVTFTREKLTVVWLKPAANNFSSYELFHSGSSNGTQVLIATRTLISDTSHVLTEFNPIVENWFWVNVKDSLEYSSISYGYKFIHLPPEPVSVISVEYDRHQMVVTWNKSNSNIFGSYNLYYSDAEDGIKSLISTKYSKSENEHIIEDFDPTHENWFWVTVTDTFGYTSTYGNSFMILDPPPDPTSLYYIKYTDNSFHVSWQKNTNHDFESYELHESETENMDDFVLISKGKTLTDTTFSIDNVMLDEFKYYKVIVYDYWDLYTESTIRRGSSYPLIASNSYQDGKNNIIITDIDGENKVPIALSNSNENYPQFSPDGKSILYSYEGNLLIMNKYGENKTQLVNGIGQYSLGKFSNDGFKIVYSSNMNGNWDIYKVNTDGTGQASLTDNSGYDTFPAFMPSGNKIAFISNMNGSPELYLMDEDGTNKEQLTFDGVAKDYLQISPDGLSFIYVNSDMPAEEDILLFNLNTKEITNLTNRSNTDYSPIFSPDGNTIFYQAMNSTWDIWSMNINGENKFNISNSSNDDAYPDVYYDGSKIVYHSRINGKSQIFTIDKNGNNLQRITNDNYDYYNPQFQKRK